MGTKKENKTNSAPQKKGVLPVDKQDIKEAAKTAYSEAEKDISNDPDLSIHSPNDDLDEAETARLGGDKTDLV